MVVFAIAILMTTALFIMFHYSRKALKEEALQKATQKLEATVQHVDNILLSVEQSAGNVYWDLLSHMDQPERMFVYSRKLVETNPYIAGCAIVMEPYYYKDYGQYFMAYFHRVGSDGPDTVRTSIRQAASFGKVPYVEQTWYSTPMETGRPCWINPLKDLDAEGEAIITFGIPIYGPAGKPVGVLAVDVALKLLSKVVQAAKPSPNSYATLLGSNGSFIVHPDSTKLMHDEALRETISGNDASVGPAATAMMAGETGYMHIRGAGTDRYVFYKPFTLSDVPGRAEQQLGWSIGIVYPEDDIFGDYHKLVYTVVSIAVVGLLLLLLLCRAITHRQLLPLRMLTKSAQRMAGGHYDEPVPDSLQQDEVGRLQNHFQQMQQVLAEHVGEMERLTGTLQERSEVLSVAYEQAREADRVKTAFLHHMTNQMTAPVADICRQVGKLHEQGLQIGQDEANQLVDDMQQQCQATTDLLDNLLDVSQEKV